MFNKAQSNALIMTGRRFKVREYVSLGVKQDFIRKFRKGFYDGLSRRDVAMQFNVSKSTVTSWIDKADVILGIQPDGRDSKIIRQKKSSLNMGLFNGKG